MADKKIEGIFSYHEQTKHRYQGYAKGPGHLDWATQPNPFRRFQEAPLVYLPPIVEDESPPYFKLFESSPIPSQEINVYQISRFLELSLAISAWKQMGDSKWALRSNPSSGNLHPTEGYLILDSLKNVHNQAGVYHYAPEEHGLERRTEFSSQLFNELIEEVPKDAFLMGLTSIHWREAWKYGERAFRYCQHDIGHALAALRIAAAVLGWNLILIEAISDMHLSQLLGLDRKGDFLNAELEHPDLLAIVTNCKTSNVVTSGINTVALNKIVDQPWFGKANRLSSNNRIWDAIDFAAEHSIKNESKSLNSNFQRTSYSLTNFSLELRQERISCRQIIRQRRSAVSFDGVTGLTDQQFYSILIQTIHNIPWDCTTWEPRIHLALFVHRVKGIKPGLYFLVRNNLKLENLKESMKSEFVWENPSGCPDDLNLYLLQEGSFQTIASRVSCNQDIAGQSAFSLGMISDFSSPIKSEGAWYYRRLFWESGMLGQMLYLAAEFSGLRGTGIGCYFDDPVHEILGLQDNSFQSLYHFTIGGAVEDKRLSTLPSYTWSCDLVRPRFVSRNSGCEINPSQRILKSLPEKAKVSWRGRGLSRIGLGTRNFSLINSQHETSLMSYLKGPMNVVEVSPDWTHGSDEILLGDCINKTLESELMEAEALFIISRTGPVRGNNLRMFEEMNRRNQPIPNIFDLKEGLGHCLHPEFLNDQMLRSIHRIGCSSLDLLLVDVPYALVKILGKVELFKQLKMSSEFLQMQCQKGRLKGFGVSLGDLFPENENAPWFTPKEIFQVFREFQGFQAVELVGNFIESRPFKEFNGNKSFIQEIKENGLLTLVGTPLRAHYEGREILLIDYPNIEEIDSEAKWDWVLGELESTTNQIHLSSMADGRTLKEVLQASGISSPFYFRRAVETAQKFQPQNYDQVNQVEQNINNLYLRARGLGEQVVQARLWDPAHFDEKMNEAHELLDWVIQCIKIRGSQGESSFYDEIRDKYFPNLSNDISLQTLGILWLFDHGVDIVLNGMRRQSYINEAKAILEGL